MDPRRIKAIICDHDGTLADTQKLHALVESRVFAEYGIAIKPEEITRRFAGVSGREMFPQVFSEVNQPLPDLGVLAAHKYELLMRITNEIEEIRGSCTFVRCVSNLGYPLAVASASRLDFIELSLKKLRIRDRFHAIATSHEVARGKPAPDVFLLAASRLGIDPKECVVIEDGVSGMIGAREAGMQVIALAEDTNRKYPADLVVTSFRELHQQDLFGLFAE